MLKYLEIRRNKTKRHKIYQNAQSTVLDVSGIENNIIYQKIPLSLLACIPDSGLSGAPCGTVCVSAVFTDTHTLARRVPVCVCVCVCACVCVCVYAHPFSPPAPVVTDRCVIVSMSYSPV